VVSGFGPRFEFRFQYRFLRAGVDAVRIGVFGLKGDRPATAIRIEARIHRALMEASRREFGAWSPQSGARVQFGELGDEEAASSYHVAFCTQARSSVNKIFTTLKRWTVSSSLEFVWYSLLKFASSAEKNSN